MPFFFLSLIGSSLRTFQSPQQPNSCPCHSHQKNIPPKGSLASCPCRTAPASSLPNRVPPAALRGQAAGFSEEEPFPFFCLAVGSKGATQTIYYNRLQPSVI